MAFAARTERAAGRRADARFVDELHGQRARIIKTVDRAEEIERRLGLGEAHPPGRREPFA